MNVPIRRLYDHGAATSGHTVGVGIAERDLQRPRCATPRRGSIGGNHVNPTPHGHHIRRGSAGGQCKKGGKGDQEFHAGDGMAAGVVQQGK